MRNKSTIIVFALGVLSCLPLSAANVTWTFGTTSPTLSYLNNQDGSTLTGSFVYDAATGTYGLFGDLSSVFTTAGTGSGDPTVPPGFSNPSNPGNSYPVIPTSSTWWVDQRGAVGCCSFQNQITLVNVDPNLPVNADLSGAIGIGIVLHSAMTDLAPSTTVYIGLDFMIAGTCITTNCDVWNSSVGFPIVNDVTLNAPVYDINDNFVSGSYITATSVAQDPVPEPATFVLAGVALLAVGLARRKFSAITRS